MSLLSQKVKLLRKKEDSPTGPLISVSGGRVSDNYYHPPPRPNGENNLKHLNLVTGIMLVTS